MKRKLHPTATAQRSSPGHVKASRPPQILASKPDHGKRNENRTTPRAGLAAVKSASATETRSTGSRSGDPAGNPAERSSAPMAPAARNSPIRKTVPGDRRSAWVFSAGLPAVVLLQRLDRHGLLLE